ncbi:MAG: hypothetical protein NC293_13880, partial [Roseburia sp.]|nr:hypothetical protein [Roseburia sp.]
TLKSYSTIKADWRVIGNDGDVQNKRLFCYFDQFDAIKTTDAFATSSNKTASAHVSLGKVGTNEVSTPVAAGAPNESREVRFGVEISMAEGVDKESGITLSNGVSSKENSKWLPSYYSTWKPEDASTHYAADSCTSGFKWAETDEYTAGFATKYLTFNTARINEADATLLDQSKFDVVIGTTYKGDSQLSGNHIFYYVDNVALVEEDIPITGFDLSTDDGSRVAAGSELQISVKYTPEETTQKGLTWTSNNDKVTVNSEGKVSVAEDFVFDEGTTEKKVVVTATSIANPSLTKSVEITVYMPEKASGDFVVDLAAMYDPAMSDEGTAVEATTDANGTPCWKLTFTKNNQRLFFKVSDTGVDLSSYETYEIVGFVPAQLSFDTWAGTLDKAVDKWWEGPARGAGTYPFFGGSRPGRLEDGTPEGEFGIETISSSLNSIKKGDWSKTVWVSIGSNQVPDDDWEECTYYIYSLKFIPKAEGADVETPSIEAPAE